MLLPPPLVSTFLSLPLRLSLLFTPTMCLSTYLVLSECVEVGGMVPRRGPKLANGLMRLVAGLVGHVEDALYGQQRHHTAPAWVVSDRGWAPQLKLLLPQQLVQARVAGRG